MIIRKAALTDHKALMALYNDFVEEDRYSGLGNDSFQKVIASQHNFALVAEDGSKLAGFITGSVRLVVRYPQPIMQVDELYVAPEFREHGLGTKLIEQMEAIAKKNGYKRIYIESGSKLKIAHKFYQANGYKKSGYYFLKVF